MKKAERVPVVELQREREAELPRQAREEEERNERRQMLQRQEKREAQAAREVKWKRALDMCQSPHPDVVRRGMELMNRLEAEEAAEQEL